MGCTLEGGIELKPFGLPAEFGGAANVPKDPFRCNRATAQALGGDAGADRTAEGVDQEVAGSGKEPGSEIRDVNRLHGAVCWQTERHRRTPVGQRVCAAVATFDHVAREPASSRGTEGAGPDGVSAVAIRGMTPLTASGYQMLVPTGVGRKYLPVVRCPDRRHRQQRSGITSKGTAMEPSSSVIARLGIAQTLARVSTYYLPTTLATPMAKDLGARYPLRPNHRWIAVRMTASIRISAVGSDKIE